MRATAALCLRPGATNALAMPVLDKNDTPLPTTTVNWRFPSVHPEGRKYVVIAAFITLAAYTMVSPTMIQPRKVLKL